MPWYQLPDGRRRFANPGSQTERRVKRRGGTLTDEPQPEPQGQEGQSQLETPAEAPPEQSAGDMTVEVLVHHATDADLQTVERLIQEETVGQHRSTALEQLARIRDNKAQQGEE